MIQSVNLPASALPVYTLQQSLHLQCTLQPCTAICSQPSVHTAVVLSSAHCSYAIQCTLQLYYPVHTAVILSSAHCSYIIQCTHSAATLSGSNTIQYIQCTFEPPQGKPIPLLAYLQNSQQTLMIVCSCPLDEEDWLIIAVQMMKKTGCL